MPAETTVDDIINALSNEQEQMLLFGIKDAYEQLMQNDYPQANQLLENLANNEPLLNHLVSMLERVQSLNGAPPQHYNNMVGM